MPHDECTSSAPAARHERLVAALNLWVELTGFDPDRRQFSLGTWRIDGMSKAIREGLELDETNITGFLLLSYFSREFIKSCSFDALSMIENPEPSRQFLDLAGRLLQVLQDREMLDELSHFQLVTRQAIRHYQADRPEVMEVISSQDGMAFLRRDALRSMQRLRVDHFLTGEPESAEVRPVYNRDVYQFWNINSLLNSLCRMPSGVSLNLIRTPDDFQSYFVFAIRNGGHVITLSDVPSHAHPLQAYMSRRPDRDFGERSAKNWFPYGLMNYSYDEESGRIWIEKQDLGSGLAPLNQTAFPLAAIKDLEPEEIIWVSLMFELIVERFWRQPVQAPQLSYTADMLRVETALLDVAGEAGLPVVQYQGISAAALTLEEVAFPDEEMQTQLGSRGTTRNDWLVERYYREVNPELMNVQASGDVSPYLVVGQEGAGLRIGSESDIQKVVGPFSSDRDKVVEYHKLDSSGFGSREQVLADRAFIARHNLARDITRLARAEFDRRKDEVFGWYTERLEENVTALGAMALAAGPNLWIERHGDQCAEVSVSCRWDQARGRQRYFFGSLVTREEYNKHTLSYMPKHLLYGSYERGRPTCYFTGAAASFLLMLKPQCAEDLALLAGVQVDDLPDVLRCWQEVSSYRGNSILDRIDPVAWGIKNPWQDRAYFSVGLWMSKTALNKLVSIHDLPSSVAFYRSRTDGWPEDLPDPFR